MDLFLLLDAETEELLGRQEWKSGVGKSEGSGSITLSKLPNLSLSEIPSM